MNQEAWRVYYGQTATHRQTGTSSKLDLKLPHGDQDLPSGWSRRTEAHPEGDVTVYVSPDGNEYDSLSFAYESVRPLTGKPGEKSEALKAMTKLLHEYKEGHVLEAETPAQTGVEAVAATANKALGYALSQLDDWIHRGDHPIVKDLSLYIYSMWIYRAERNPYAVVSSTECPKLSTVDIPFDDSYIAGRTWVQRLALEPRLPKVEGLQFITDVDPEMHFLLKAVLLRPVYLPPAIDDSDTRQLRTLRGYQELCTAPEGEERWCALNEGPNKPGPFERGWRSFIEHERSLMEKARFKCMSRHKMWSKPSLWETVEVAEFLQGQRMLSKSRSPDADVHSDVPNGLEAEDLGWLNSPDIGYAQQVSPSRNFILL